MSKEGLATIGLVASPRARIVPVAQALPRSSGSPLVVEVKLLGRFSVTLGDQSNGQWPRPSARRLCQLVLTSPGRRVERERVCEALFPTLGGEAAARSLYRAVSMARITLRKLGSPGADWLRADSHQIWADPSVELLVDLDAHEQALRRALLADPGMPRDSSLVQALEVRGVPLEDEPEAEWAHAVRARIGCVRQQARLELARDRWRGVGRARPEEVLDAWQACFEADATCEEAASALMRIYLAQSRRAPAVAVYERCSGALSTLGLKVPCELEELRTVVDRAASLDDHTSAPGVGRPAIRPGEERRRVTVAVVEFSPVGLGPHADPEDVREVVGAGLARTASEVEVFSGTVMSISGPVMTLLFGVPHTHEDDPERALRAAVRVLASVGRQGGKSHGYAIDRAELPPCETLSVRVGVETGLAVVGTAGIADQLGYSAEGAVMGAAAALQSVARPNSVLVGPVTRAATEGIFEWGASHPVPVFQDAEPLSATYLEQPLARPAVEVGRRRMAARVPLIGRQAELRLLVEAVQTTISGHGAAVMISGEAGLGKSRLVGESRNYFMGWVGAASGRLPLWLEGRCASYASSTPYGAYQQLLSRFIGVPLEGGEAVLRPALEALPRAVLGKGTEPVSLLARMLGLPPRPNEVYLDRLGPSELQERTFAAVGSLLQGLLSRGPTVLALEDLHWSDPTSLRLTANLATLLSTGPLLLLATRRPEPDPGIGDLETELSTIPARRFRVLQLAPMDRLDERRLACSLLGGDADDNVVEFVCQGVDGNPLFLEERLASLIDAGALQHGGSGWHARPGTPNEVPEALERLIRSRADRLSPAGREAIVAASILGDDAERRAIGAVSQLTTELDAALSELVSGGFLIEDGRQLEPFYRFRHILIRDAVYQSLLRSERRRLHARAAWHMEVSAGDGLADMAAHLGQHWAAAGENDRAMYYFEMAADRAARDYANEESVALYRRAISLVCTDAIAGVSPSPSTSIISPRLSRYYEKLCSILTLVDSFVEAGTAAKEGIARLRAVDRTGAAWLYLHLGKIEYQRQCFDAASAAYDAAEALIGPCRLDDDQQHIDLWLSLQIIGKLQLHLLGRNDLERSSLLIESIRPLVEARGDKDSRTMFEHFSLCNRVQFLRYRLDRSIIDEFRRSTQAIRTLTPGAGVLMRPESRWCLAMSYLGVMLTWYGDLQAARDVHHRALASARRQGSPGARGRVLIDLAVTAMRAGDIEAVQELTAEGRDAVATTGLQYYVAAASALEAWAAWRSGRADDVRKLGINALGLWDSQPVPYPFHCLALWPLIGTYLGAGQTEKGIEAGRRLLEPPQLRMPDEIEATLQAASDLYESGEVKQAAGLLGEAIQLARQCGYA
jgi:adenylate cyclase